MPCDKSFLAAEEDVINNVANKLQIYMERSHLTLHGLASKLNFQYQAIWRLVNKKHSPTITSLAMISEHLECNINELISNDIFIDVELFDNLNTFVDRTLKEIIRIYIPYDQFTSLAKQSFFVIETIQKNGSDETALNTSYMSIFYNVSNIDIDGLFLVKYQNKVVMLDIFSVSSQFIWANINKVEVKIAKSEIVPMAKFFNYLNLLGDTKFILTGATKCKNS